MDAIKDTAGCGAAFLVAPSSKARFDVPTAVPSSATAPQAGLGSGRAAPSPPQGGDSDATWNNARIGRTSQNISQGGVARFNLWAHTAEFTVQDRCPLRHRETV